MEQDFDTSVRTGCGDRGLRTQAARAVRRGGCGRGDFWSDEKCSG